MIWKINGEKLVQITSDRNTGMHITSDGKLLLALSATSYKISIIDVESRKEINYIKEKDRLISSYLSRNDKFFLVNISYTSPEIHLWSLENYELINRFEGYKQSSFMLRCCMGWKDEQLISCGSEDGKLYIWHRFHKKPIKIL